MSKDIKCYVDQRFGPIWDVMILERTLPTEDDRGYITSIHREDERGGLGTASNGIPMQVPLVSNLEQKCSFSRKYSLRGMHAERFLTKTVTCLLGKIDLILFDMRTNSPTRGMHMQFIIDAIKSPLNIRIPPGVANGHLALEDCLFYYNQNDCYNIQDQLTFNAKSPEIAHLWSYQEDLIQPYIRSERDIEAPNYTDLVESLKRHD